MSYSIVGEQILKFRKERGFTQKELGEAIGISSSAVSQWESGGTPDISLLPALSDVLGVTGDALFGRSEARRENIEETVGKYIASLPEEKRMERIVSLMRSVSDAACAGRGLCRRGLSPDRERVSHNAGHFGRFRGAAWAQASPAQRTVQLS